MANQKEKAQKRRHRLYKYLRKEVLPTAFCPGCGYATETLVRCSNCDHEQEISIELENLYCLQCGEPLQ